MSRPRKIEAAAAPGKITCPACRSSVSSDGATLFQRSKRLESLEEAESGVEEIAKNLAELEKELKTLRAENEQLKARPVPPGLPTTPRAEDKDAQFRR